MSHELRTPLAVICSAGENLADGLVHDSQQVRRYGALIESEGRRLADMVDRVLDFAGSLSGRPAYERDECEVASLVSEAIEGCRPLLEESHSEIETRIEPRLPLVTGDRAALRSALQNLIGNAVKYRGGRGWIGIEARAVSRKRGPEVEIEVSDHGLGIHPADLPRIFEPFYRGRAALAGQIRGTGVGLSVVRRTVEAHGGEIQVSSMEGKGSTFIVRLPALARAAGELAAKQA